MSNNEDWKIQVSFKTPGGTLINVRAETPAELKELLVGTDVIALDIIGSERKFTAVNTLAPLSTGGSTETQSSQDFSGQGFPSTPPVATAPVAQGPTCAHGARVHKTGVGAKGPWSAWMCPTPKGTVGQCAPAWG